MFPLHFQWIYRVFCRKKFDYLIILFAAYIGHSPNFFAFYISLRDFIAATPSKANRLRKSGIRKDSRYEVPLCVVRCLENQHTEINRISDISFIIFWQCSSY